MSDKNVQTWFRTLFLLSLIPTQFVRMKFELIALMPDFSEELKLKLQPFVAYVKRTYIESNFFTIEMWNHFSTRYERTNNRVEADNGSMKSNCGAAYPDINKATGHLRQYELRSRIMYSNASKINAVPYMSRRDDHDRDGVSEGSKNVPAWS